jgi:flagellar protein FlbD
MIHLTRLNKHPVVVNSDLIKFVENTPDTVVTLISGEKIVVSEAVEQVLDRIIEFRRRLLVCPHRPRPFRAEVSAPAEPSEDAEA